MFSYIFFVKLKNWTFTDEKQQLFFSIKNIIQIKDSIHTAGLTIPKHKIWFL